MKLLIKLDSENRLRKGGTCKAQERDEGKERGKEK